jgi:hypothetical protein
MTAGWDCRRESRYLAERGHTPLKLRNTESQANPIARCASSTVHGIPRSSSSSLRPPTSEPDHSSSQTQSVKPACQAQTNSSLSPERATAYKATESTDRLCMTYPAPEMSWDPAGREPPQAKSFVSFTSPVRRNRNQSRPSDWECQGHWLAPGDDQVQRLKQLIDPILSVRFLSAKQG